MLFWSSLIIHNNSKLIYPVNLKIMITLKKVMFLMCLQDAHQPLGHGGRDKMLRGLLTVSSKISCIQK